MDQAPDQAELARLCYDVLEADRRGAKIMAYLLTRYARRPAMGRGLDTLIDTVRVDAHREMLDHLVMMINLGGQAHQPDGTEVEFDPS